MKNHNFPIHRMAVICSLMFLILSCNPYNHLAEYPNFGIPDKRIDLSQISDRHLLSPKQERKSSEEISINSTTLQYMELTGLNTTVSYVDYPLTYYNIRQITLKQALIPVAGRNALLMTKAADQSISDLSACVDSLGHSKRLVISPDTTKLTQTESDPESGTKAAKHKDGSQAALFSVIAAVLAILTYSTLIGFPVFSLTALIFGALGLKSPKKTLALIGFIFGILATGLIILLAFNMSYMLGYDM